MITPGNMSDALLHGDDDSGSGANAHRSASHLQWAFLAGAVVSIGCWKVTSSLVTAAIVMILWTVTLLIGQRMFDSALPDSVIVLGQGSVATLLSAMLAEKPSAPWWNPTRSRSPNLRRLSTIGEASDVISSTGCRCVVVSDPREARRVTTLLSSASAPLRVVDGIQLLVRTLGRVPIELTESDGWSMTGPAQRQASVYLAGKRLIDLVLAIALGIIVLPLIPLIAMAILIDSHGPILYRQTRVGMDRQLFSIFKFRTMHCDAERDGAVWATVNDPRVTRFGRFMRLTRLDELPQIWNVLRGDMSFVGPRPERPEFSELLERDIPAYRHRHAVRPGLTGWAQVRFRYTASLHDSRKKLEYDLYYIRNASLLLDLQILIRTIGVVLGMKGR